MPLLYSPAVTGKNINEAIQASTSSLTGTSGSGAGDLTWQNSLNKLYTDFDTTLATSLQTFLMTTKVIFPPAIPMLIQAILPALNMTSLSSGSGSLLSANIKSQTSSLTGPSGSAAGSIIWTEFCGQVGTDLLASVPAAVCLCCANKIPIVSAGFMAPPMVASLAPAPPIYKGLIPATLTGLLTPYMTTGIKTLGPMIDVAAKAKTSSLTGEAGKNAGILVWNTVLEILAPAITLELSTKLSLFMAMSIGAWMTTPSPGLPILPNGNPTPGASSLPAINVLV